MSIKVKSNQVNLNHCSKVSGRQEPSSTYNLEPSDLGHRIGSFSTIQTVYAKVGQLKVNNNQVMCNLSIKVSDTFDQNPPCTFDKIREKTHSDEKCSYGLTLRAKVKVIAKTKRKCPRKQ